MSEHSTKQNIDRFRSTKFCLIINDTFSFVWCWCGCTKKPHNLKSCGLDGVSVWLFTKCSQELIKPLTLLINNSLSEAIHPEYFKLGEVIPLYKNGNLK